MLKFRTDAIHKRPLDLLFTERYSFKAGRKISGYELLLRQTYKQALTGETRAIKSILKFAREIEHFHGDPHFPTRYSNTAPYVSAEPAMRLLGILVEFKEPESVPQGLAPWVAEALAERKIWCNRSYVCKPDEIDGSRYLLSQDPLYVPARPARDPAATRFKPGESGNPLGRRRVYRGSSAPVHFLDERVKVKVNGRAREITRLQNLLFKLELMAAKGDEDIRKLLLEFGLKVEAARYRHNREPDQLYFSQDAWINDLGFFHRHLKDVEILSQRSRKYHLMMPWIVELALARLEPGALNDEEQVVVVRATSTPEKVRWPDWWGEENRRRRPLKRREGHVTLSYTDDCDRSLVDTGWGRPRRW